MSYFSKVCAKMGMLCVEEYQFHQKRKWRCDYFFPEVSLAVEIEGGLWSSVHGKKSRHFHGSGAAGDMEKYNALTESGIFLLRFQPN